MDKIISFFAGCAACFYVYLGHTWVTEGWGLHPLIVVLVVGVEFALICLWAWESRDEEEWA